jgi:hypothetical protein
VLFKVRVLLGAVTAKCVAAPGVTVMALLAAVRVPAVAVMVQGPMFPPVAVFRVATAKAYTRRGASWHKLTRTGTPIS